MGGPNTYEGKNKVTKNLPDERDDAWGFSKKGKEALAKANHMNKLKHGFYASIPILCKGKECPYTDACYIQKGEYPKGEPCPVEASTIEKLVEKYCKEFEVTEDEMVDISMIKNLVNIDISLTRCDKKLATDPDIVKQVVISVTEDGQPIRKPEIDKSYELRDKLWRQRRNILNDLMGTRKAKAETEQESNQDPSSIVAKMKEKISSSKDEDDEIEIEVIKEN